MCGIVIRTISKCSAVSSKNPSRISRYAFYWCLCLYRIHAILLRLLYFMSCYRRGREEGRKGALWMGCIITIDDV